MSKIALENTFVHYKRGRVTVAMKVLRSGRVAVARTFTLPTDKYDKAEGKDRALKRLRGFYAQFLTNRRKQRYQTVYRQRDEDLPGHVLFEVIDPKDLAGSEKAFFEKRVLPNLE